ncbi:MAG: excinuclease ABC subunit UvrC [Smithellaceae bacterium]|nr:excinuclease ABC subunit UvrC [Smithellaceae bacterium]
MNSGKYEELKDLVKSFPHVPGVYLMKDAQGNIIYVGKASSLRNRVGSYFVSFHRQSKKTQQLLTHIEEIEYFITHTEEEALVLELNFIKQYRPHYNIALKDDKSFPYIKIDLNQKWPSVCVTRKLISDGARYFGPYGSGVSIRQTIKVIKKIFPFRSCRGPIEGKRTRPCLEYDMGHCLGPCCGKTSQEEYRNVINKLVLFLEGRHNKVIKEMETEMKQAASIEEFEKAALLRDQVGNLKKILTYQEMATRVKGDRDAIALYRDERESYVQVFFVRSGKITGREGYFLANTKYETDSIVLTNFVQQFYDSAATIPPVILLQHPVENRTVIQNWLRTRARQAVTISVPVKGPKKELIDMVAENARQGLESARFKLVKEEGGQAQLLPALQEQLNLKRAPERIEGYDISNLSGRMAVGSMVVFEKGKPATSQYRRFRIKTVEGADDYGMLREVITRRFKRGDSVSESGWVLPDLVLIDGGKGQLRAVLGVLPADISEKVSFISLAKENEEIFTPFSNIPILLPKNSPVLQLLQRIRDEAHRFAVSYHRSIRSKKGVESLLDGIIGIGPRRKKVLMKHFGSLDNMRKATIEQITQVNGITPALAQRIKERI